MNYKKWLYDNQKTLNYKVIWTNGMIATIECNQCGARKQIQIKSLIKNRNKIHNQFCSQYYLNIAKKEIGNKAAMNFHNTYRRAHERCLNPNCKDYQKYKNKFHFIDFCEYFKSCYELYKDALKHHDSNELSIDRIDGTKGYEPGNIRFVTMTENLKNKYYVKPVKATNIIDGNVIVGVSFGDLADKLTKYNKNNIVYPSTLHKAYTENKTYLKQWKIEIC